MLIYLASPYTHSDPEIEDQRARIVCRVAARLLNLGHHVISPIAFCHQIKRCAAISGKFEFWRELDEKLLQACDKLWVLKLAGWEESVGVQYEIKYMESLGKPVDYVYPLLEEYA